MRCAVDESWRLRCESASLRIWKRKACGARTLTFQLFLRFTGLWNLTCMSKRNLYVKIWNSCGRAWECWVLIDISSDRSWTRFYRSHTGHSERAGAKVNLEITNLKRDGQYVIPVFFLHANGNHDPLSNVEGAFRQYSKDAHTDSCSQNF